MEPTYLSLVQVARLAPSRPSANAVWRWCREGLKGRNGERVKLRHVRSGAKVYTTQEWLRDFFDAVVEADAAHFEERQRPVAKPPKNRRRNAAERERAVAKAKRELGESLS